MPRVDIEAVEKRNKIEEDSINQIKTKYVGEKAYYKGPFIDEWYDNSDECRRDNQTFARQKAYKDQGLDELGRTPAQVRLSAEKEKLQAEKLQLLEEARKIDVKIASLKEEDFEKHDHKKHGKKG